MGGRKENADREYSPIYVIKFHLYCNPKEKIHFNYFTKVQLRHIRVQQLGQDQADKKWQSSSSRCRGVQPWRHWATLEEELSWVTH